MSLTKHDVLNAAQNIKGYAHITPILRCNTIDSLLNAEVFFKCENFQKVGAFKFRGAFNALTELSKMGKLTAVATHSSGNHAQALALAAKIKGIKAYIVMPSNAPLLKRKAVDSYGGHISFCEPTLEAREQMLMQCIENTKAIEVHPYNNVHIIAGQATAAKEILSAVPDLDYIMAPVGGGGLLSGTALSTYFFSPHTKVLGAEPFLANDAFLSFNSKTLIPSNYPNTIADGLKTSLGSITFPIILNYVDDILTAQEATIMKAMKLVWERMKIIIEPSAAVPLACLLEKPLVNINKKPRIGIILSGGNVDFPF